MPYTYSTSTLKRILPAVLCLLFFSAGVAGQDAPARPGSLDSGDIKSQFEYLSDKSNNFQEYKVVRRTWLSKLESNIADSLKKMENELAAMKKARGATEKEIAGLNEALETAHNELQQARDTKNSISFLGIPAGKGVYNSIMWGIVLVLAALLLTFIYKFKKSHLITSQTLSTLEETKEEFDLHRKRALERERKLNRRLQDELNKQLK